MVPRAGTGVSPRRRPALEIAVLSQGLGPQLAVPVGEEEELSRYGISTFYSFARPCRRDSGKPHTGAGRSEKVHAVIALRRRPRARKQAPDIDSHERGGNEPQAESTENRPPTFCGTGKVANPSSAAIF